MTAFRAGEIQVLLSTSVIEVGVDVPNATVMLIENAERFGLAQLHQLRGRIGRGEHPSYCVLVGEPKSLEGWRRLRIMEETTDGFRIAEEDFKIRGPGNIFGTEQSGLPPLRFASLETDYELLTRRASDAARFIKEDPTLANGRACGENAGRRRGSRLVGGGELKAPKIKSATVTDQRYTSSHEHHLLQDHCPRNPGPDRPTRTTGCLAFHDVSPKRRSIF